MFSNSLKITIASLLCIILFTGVIYKKFYYTDSPSNRNTKESPIVETEKRSVYTQPTSEETKQLISNMNSYYYYRNCVYNTRGFDGDGEKFNADTRKEIQASNFAVLPNTESNVRMHIIVDQRTHKRYLVLDSKVGIAIQPLD